MIDKRLVLLPLVLLAGTSLSGCVVVAIPALAGSTMIGSRVIDREDPAENPAAAPAPAAATVAAPPSAPVVKPVQAAPVPTVTVAAAPPAATPSVTTPVTPRPMPLPAPVAAPIRPPAAQQPAAPAPAPLVSFPSPDNPLPPGQATFARFVRYAEASARGLSGGADLTSAMLSDPVALDGKRRRCAVSEQLVALIDLDPVDGMFAPPAAPAPQPGVALGLALLRDAGVEIAWLTDLPVVQSGAVRTALERSGLDPRGQDIISLRRDEADTKQQRKDSLAGITCIIAIAGDERPDFDERFKYLRNPEVGAGIEPLIGDGWFLIEPLLGK